MPTGSFIGVGNFKGLWNATTNSGSNSDLAPPLSNLLANSASVGAGYGLATGLTASVGDYWQVFVAGSTSVDGETSWALNDWCVYQSSSASGMGWNRLSVTDTIAATILGDPSESGLKKVLLMSASANAGPTNAYGPNGELLFCSASNATGVDKYFEGNPKLTWNNNASILNVTGTLKVSGTIEATTLHTVEVTSSVLFEDGSTRFGNDADDSHEFSGSVYVLTGLTSSAGISGSYFMGDGSGLTGISAGSSLGNPGYGNPGTSRVPFWGVIDGSSKYGLSGSANLSFFTASNDLQVTGTIRATNMHVTDKIYHEGDIDTYIDFGTEVINLYAGNTALMRFTQSATQATVYVNQGAGDVDFQIYHSAGGNNTSLKTIGSTGYVAINHSNPAAPLDVGGSTIIGSASAHIHRFTGSARFSNPIVIGDGSATDGIYHWNDADTKIVFADDQIDFTAGGVTLLTLDEAGQDIVTVGDGTDVDFQVKGLNDNHAIFVEGSSDKVGIGYSSPDKKLSVSGSTIFGRPSSEGDTHWFSGSAYVSDDIHVADRISHLDDSDTFFNFNANTINATAGNIRAFENTTNQFEFNPDGETFTVSAQGSSVSNTFYINGPADNVGIRCAPLNLIEALVVSGSTLFGSASANTHQFTGSIMTNSSIYFNDDLINWNDDDTKISFTDDRMRFYVGNVVMLDLTEAGSDTIKLGDGSDVDTIVQTDNSDRTLWIDGGNDAVGIGCAPSGSGNAFKLSVSGTMRLGNSLSHDHVMTGSLELTGNLGLNTTASSYSLALPNTDTLMGRGVAYAWSTYSSARYKDNVFTLKNPLDTAKKLRGVEFTWKESGHQDFGFIAEEVGKVLPQLVSYEADGKSAIGMDYAKITSLLVECVKTQQVQIETQDKRIKTLEKKLKS